MTYRGLLAKLIDGFHKDDCLPCPLYDDTEHCPTWTVGDDPSTNECARRLKRYFEAQERTA